jgi:hypothetical protein
MALRQSKKISELTSLTSASLDTIVVGVDNGITYKIELDVLADGVSNRINALDSNRLQSLETFTSSFIAVSIPAGTISGSSQLTASYDLRYAASGAVGGEIGNLQQILNNGAGASNYNGTGSASIQLTNFTNNRTLYINNNDYPTIKMEDNNNAANNLTIDIDSLILDNVSYNWADIVNQSIDTGSFATTGSNYFYGEQYISGAIYLTNEGSGAIITLVPVISGSDSSLYNDLSGDFVIASVESDITFFTLLNNVIPSSSQNITDVALVSLTRSGSLDVYANMMVSGSIVGDGGGLYNLPSTTNWNKDKEYILRNTEQLTFSGDYILENAYLEIEGGTPNSIGEWIEVIFTNDRSGSVTKTGNNTYTLVTPHEGTSASDAIQIKRFFDTETTMSVHYVWNGEDVGNDRPYYDVGIYDPTEPDSATRLQNPNATSETGTWTINVPANNWVAIGAWTDNNNTTYGTLQLTLPYLFGEDVQYSSNKYFKKEGTIFIGGNLLVKDSYIENDGLISVGGEVILIGNSQIIGTGKII